MLALTLHQPWASLWAHHIKFFETRDWPPPKTFVLPYPLAIHAGKNRLEGRGPFEDLPLIARYQRATETGRRLEDFLRRYETFGELPFGAIVGVHRLVACHRTQSIPREPVDLVGPIEEALGDFAPGLWAWETESPHVLRDPIRARGHQKLWRWDPPPNLNLLLDPPLPAQEAPHA